MGNAIMVSIPKQGPMQLERSISQNFPTKPALVAPNALVDADRRGPLRLGALDIGGSHVAAALVTLEDGVASLDRRADEPLDPHAPAAAIVTGIASAASSVGKSDLWAVAVPGPFDYVRGRGSFEGVGKFDALSGVDLGVELARGLGVPPSAVRFVNDATAYGIGEWAFGAARGHRRAICLTLGTGIGSVFLLDGIPVDQGEDVPPGGHMHLQSFHGRPLEDFVSSRAIAAQYRSLTARESSVQQICARAGSGDLHALQVIDRAMSVLGASVGPWLEAFGASAIIIGGSISRSWDVLEEPLRRGLASHSASVARNVLLAQARLLDDAPLLGAAAWLSRHL